MEYLPGGSAQVSAAAAVGGLEPIQYPEYPIQYPEHPEHHVSHVPCVCAVRAQESAANGTISSYDGGDQVPAPTRPRRPRTRPRRPLPNDNKCGMRTWRSRPRPRLQCMCAPRAAACSARAWPVQWGSVGTGGCGAGWSGRVSHWYGRACPQGVTGVRLSTSLVLVYSTGCLPVPYPCWVWSGTRDGGRACAGLPERVV